MAIICQNCGHDEFLGAIFCSECGSKLIDESGLSTQTLAKEKRRGNSEQVGTVSIMQPSVSELSKSTVTLYLPDFDKTMPLEGKKKYTLGRVSTGQQILPDVDLADYNAFEQGVSRLHAAIEIDDSGFFITDLGSSNGTRINNEKLVPLRPHGVQHGDVITLGKLRFVVLVRS